MYLFILLLSQEVCNMVAKATGSDGRGSPVRVGRPLSRDSLEPWEMTDREREITTKIIKLIQGRIPTKVTWAVFNI